MTIAMSEVFLEELQTFKAETVEIIMNFYNGFWRPLDHASLFDLMKKNAPTFLFLIE